MSFLFVTTVSFLKGIPKKIVENQFIKKMIFVGWLGRELLTWLWNPFVYSIVFQSGIPECRIDSESGDGASASCKQHKEPWGQITWTPRGSDGKSARAWPCIQCSLTPGPRAGCLCYFVGGRRKKVKFIPKIYLNLHVFSFFWGFNDCYKKYQLYVDVACDGIMCLSLKKLTKKLLQ